MLRRVVFLTMIFLLLSPVLSEAGIFSRFSISLNPGGVWAINGKYDENQKLKDMVLSGAGLGLNFRYGISKIFFLEGGYSYSWMFIQKEKRPDAYKNSKAAFVIPMYTLNGTLLFTSSHKFKPYFTLGGGLCPWRFSSKALRGVIWTAPENEDENFSKTSLSLNTGLGAEWSIWSRISVLVEAKYYYIFSKDVRKFGSEYFTNQGLLGIRLGIIFYFGQAAPATQ